MMERRLSEVLSEFARTLVTDFSIEAILDHLVLRIVDVLPISGAGVTLMAPGAAPRYVAASDDAALDFEKIQAELGEGPCVVAYETGEAVAVPDLRLDARFPTFAERAVEAGLLAVFTFPLREGERQLGALDLYRTTAGPLDETEMVTAQTLADVASAYLLNAQARVDLEISSERARQSSLHDAAAVLALRASEERKAAILASALDPVVTIDDQGWIVEFNPAAERTFSMSKEDAIGRDLGELLTPPAALHGSWVGVADYLTTDDATVLGRRIELEAMCADGSCFPSEVSISAVKGQGPPLLFTAFIRDLTGRDAADAERRSLEDRLHQTERLESLGQLAGGVAHDFNNLLTVILNYASFIEESAVVEEPIKTYAAAILTSAQRAAQLTKQLLMFARREPVQRTSLDLNEIVTVVHGLLTRAIGEHVNLVVHPATDLLPIFVDRGQVEQMLMNLAVNARDAMPDGGTLTIETALVSLGPDQAVQLSVRDTGVGMSAEVASRAFDPFFSTKPSSEGSGLGLATVYGIVADANGTVELHSTESVGSTFTVRFPIADAVTAAEGHVTDAAPVRGAGETILVVEDQESVRSVAVAMLRRNGYRVLEAANAPEAMLIAAMEPLDLLLTDVVMPETSGPELAEALRGIALGDHVLFMSGFSGGDFSSQGVVDPSEALIRKPFNEAQLLRAVDAALHPAPVVAAPTGR
ncbi:MAG: two-component system, cell cycle sensor histidine kinase and response regulator CckA [Acidimicrobiaceae bacterium]|jgi:PAS domain S-box-containing protein